ncbi:hypothetical protein COY95_03055 [Candidatus Woesearchaeota archaeon CG_4_10_14_0_8_um_filter_47_5]|nr:MAG: hypothetical protein COY95_03055 [Candidatus Woesearchaeota archaeon CG_4_10_14_0_8_um_filter_47_5]
MVLLLVVLAVVVYGCSQSPAPPAAAPEEPASQEGAQEASEDATGAATQEPVGMPEITVDGNNGTVTAEVDTHGAVDQRIAPPVDEWCRSGETYNVESEQGSVSSTIEGMTTYKGSEFCKAVSSTTIQGMEISTTYYFTYQGKEMWVISNVAGQTTETHILN